MNLAIEHIQNYPYDVHEQREYVIELFVVADSDELGIEGRDHNEAPHHCENKYRNEEQFNFVVLVEDDHRKVEYEDDWVCKGLDIEVKVGDYSCTANH